MTHNGASMRKSPPSDLERVSDVGEIRSAILSQVSREILCRSFQCGPGLCREQQQLNRTRCVVRLVLRHNGSFFENDMRVGAADAERADAGATRCSVFLPLTQSRIDEKR